MWAEVRLIRSLVRRMVPPRTKTGMFSRVSLYLTWASPSVRFEEEMKKGRPEKRSNLKRGKGKKRKARKTAPSKSLSQKASDASDHV